MRSTIANQSNTEITKFVDANREVYEAIRDSIKDYGDWLSSSGLKVVDTIVDYRDGKIYFRQPLIDSKRSDPDFITQAILKLKFTEFGLDASPDNFLGDGLLVDLYPFLINQQGVLESQFDYPYDEIRRRYFNKVSVLVTYLIRLYKTDSSTSLRLVNTYRELLRKGVESREILPRECHRLLRLMSFGTGKEFEFGKFYKQTKRESYFADRDSKKLMQLLKNYTNQH